MLKAAFSFGFNHRIVPNGASAGVFDESYREQVVVATTTNKIVLQNAESVFHMNEQVNCIKVCRLKEDQNGAINDGFQQGHFDIVLIGTETRLVAYDVFNNKTLFHRDTPDAVRCIEVGLLDEYQTPVIVFGCGTTLWGIDDQGRDLFWTALGDEVNALAICDVNSDGINELVIGTNGVEIKVFKNASLLSEYTEGDPTITLCTIKQGWFAFGLASGVVGVYGNRERLWRVKTKLRIVSLLVFPDPESVTCVWNNGKVDIRKAENGEILAKDQVDGELMGAFVADLNNSGTKQLTLAFASGKVRGLEFRADDAPVNDGQKLLREFGQRKHHLLEELKNYESTDHTDVEKSAIPANTHLECGLELTADRGLCLQLSVSNNVPIRSVLIFAEGIFDSECYAVKQMHVFEVNKTLPRFATFLQVASVPAEPQGFVEFEFGLKPEHLGSWFLENFIISEESLEQCYSAEGLAIAFICVRNNEYAVIDINAGGKGVIRHNDIEACGGLLQSMAAHVQIAEMRSRAYFPACFDMVQGVIDSLDEKYEVDEKLQADFAERLNMVRECVVRAEDAIATRHTSDARKLYVRVAMLNRELVAQRAVRQGGHESLMESLKVLNVAIEQSAKLRVGQPAADLIRECRKAIANENLSALPKLLQFGI
ncbi:bardet-Biedl syndrome 2 protein [Aphelenchoides avenae]|nr:bardet-Biedl syndrome 2 protein [Aphelenchus avenae]